jgi:cation transport regulator ChaC
MFGMRLTSRAVMHRRRPNAAALLHFVEAHSTITDFRALWKHRKEQRAQLSRLGLRSALERGGEHHGCALGRKAQDEGRERERAKKREVDQNKLSY